MWYSAARTFHTRSDALVNSTRILDSDHRYRELLRVAGYFGEHQFPYIVRLVFGSLVIGDCSHNLSSLGLENLAGI